MLRHLHPALTKRTFVFIYFLCVFENFVVVFRYGVICAQFFFKVFALGKGWGFLGFNNEPPQGMLCLVIGLFNQHS
jgi:hypothetical protein